jgi:zinc transporter ZupT
MDYQRLVKNKGEKMENFPVVAAFVIAELLGALVYFKTEDSVKRTLLTCLGLGFAIAVVLLDIIPEILWPLATEDFASGYLLIAIGFVAMFVLGPFIKSAGKVKSAEKYPAVVGLAIHNFAEGVIITTVFGPISPILAVGAVLHKMPEGMVSFSLLEGLKDRTRFAIAALITLLIPVGAIIPISESVTKPLMALSAGVILYVVGGLLFAIVSEYYKPEIIKGQVGENNKLNFTKLSTMVMFGIIIACVSCLMA